MGNIVFLMTGGLVIYVCLCMGVVTLESLVALFGVDKAPEVPLAMPFTVVLVPAHNEQSVITATLQSLQADLPEHTRILCVAHNCSDDTASTARAQGAEVVEVNDGGKGGKPDALKAGLHWLDSQPPDVVVIVDADCTVTRGSIRLLATQAKALNRPVMGGYFFAAATAGGRAAFSSLVIMLKNFIRPLGLHRLGLPCLLNGSGSAYPFSLIRQAPQGEGSIAEDYQMTVDLLNLGYPTTFVPAARIDGQLPNKTATAQKQRRRWEHGHLHLSLQVAPKLILVGLVRRDLNRLALGLELLVPPLGYLAVMALLVGSLIWGLGGFVQSATLSMLLLVSAVWGVAMLLAWFRYAGVLVTLRALLAVPAYLVWKLPIYRDFFHKQETRWLKTERD